MPRESYSLPVNQLLTYGDCRNFDIRNWPNYLELGITSEHIDELVRMATDEDLYQADEDSLECWAPIHAWRTLGQLQAVAAIEPLISLFPKRDGDDDVWEWIGEELPIVFGMIGSSAIPALAAYLADTSQGVFSRTTAVSSLTEIGLQHPDYHTQCITVITQQLESFQKQDSELNGFIVAALVDLEAVESASVIEQAFEADCVDEGIAGDWDDVQVSLGLKTNADVDNKASRFELTQNRSVHFPELSSASTGGFQQLNSKTDNKLQTKRKIQKESRKKNRKKKN
ncbi:DUF1186 domain-containing protein [Nostoc sp. 106C]|uniref:HEAT repeat domain-containing protein n=1 Tax=Nostoc sp. 106C TaxID=1932667 RepID=UPI000A37EA04|nr:DUF1186 domain-containing protein [Nostoc sp. 106C]OUL35775.1 hypothetical protein BV375_01350 [Nostoc sp. 106C]